MIKVLISFKPWRGIICGEKYITDLTRFKLHRLILSNVHTKLMLSHNLPESSSKGNNLKLDLVKLFQYSFVRYHSFQSTHSCDNGIIQHYPRCQFDK